MQHRLHDRCACSGGLGFYNANSGAPRSFVLSGTTRTYERAKPFAIHHIALEIDLDPKTKSIVAKASLEVTRIDAQATKLQLDAVGFSIDKVAWENSTSSAKTTEYEYDGEQLQVCIPPQSNHGTLVVEYKTTPRRGLYFIEPDEHVPNRPHQVWTQCQDEDARYIFPCHDSPNLKCTTELRVRVPANWVALSNGQLLSSSKGKLNEFHFKMEEPHSSYLFTLVAGEFSILEDSCGNIPLTYYVPVGSETDGKRTFARTAEMIQHFGEKFGVSYPWNKYAQVVVSDFIFGGMENTTATTMYEHILIDQRAAIDITSDDLIAHELAHQWFGDYVTCRDWSHGWLNEGFATFMEHVDREHHLGRDEYENGLRVDLDSYLSEANGRYRRPIVCQDYEAPIDIFDRHLYEKGGLVLHLLRQKLTHDVFWSGVRLYLTRHAKGIVETRDLMRAMEEVSGQSLDRFFAQWVYRAGHPEINVDIEYNDETLTVSVKQSQSTTEHPTSGAFELDLILDIGTEKEVVRHEQKISQMQHSFVFPLAKRPKFVVVDPDFRILGDVTLKVPTDMLLEQLKKSPTARGRMLAAFWLSKKDDENAVQALGECLANENEFWAVRAEAAESLGHLRTASCFDWLAKHRTTQHPKVRRAVARALGQFKSTKAAELLQTMALNDASYLVEAEAARALGSTKQSAGFDILVELLGRNSWADVIRSGAIDGMAALRDERAWPHVLSRVRYGHTTRVRRAALMAIPKLASDRKARETLEDQLEGTDPYLRVDVVRALFELGDAKARAALHRQLDRELDGRVRRRIRETLRDLGSVGKKEADRLREEFETLRNEYRDLKIRMDKWEQLNKKKPTRIPKSNPPSKTSKRR